MKNNLIIIGSCLATLSLWLYSCSEDKEVKPKPLSSDKDLLSFSIHVHSPFNRVTEGVIDQANKTVTVTLGLFDGYGSPKLYANRTLSNGAGILPDPQYGLDYSTPKVLTIIAQDKSSVDYTVTVTRSSFKVIKTDKNTYEAGENIIITGENFWPILIEASMFEKASMKEIKLSQGMPYPQPPQTELKVAIPYFTEVGDYNLWVWTKMKEGGARTDSVLLPTNITIDFADKSPKITGIGFNRATEAGNPPLYSYSISCSGRYLGNTSEADIQNNAKLFFTKVGDPSAKTEIEISSVRVSSKLTYFDINTKKMPNTIFPGKYYLSIEFKGKTIQYPTGMEFPFVF